MKDFQNKFPELTVQGLHFLYYNYRASTSGLRRKLMEAAHYMKPYIIIIPAGGAHKKGLYEAFLLWQDRVSYR